MKFLTQHLKDSNENYFEHFLYTFSIGMWLVGTGLILLCHALMPFLFVMKSSKNIKKINQIMQKRAEDLVGKK